MSALQALFTQKSSLSEGSISLKFCWAGVNTGCLDAEQAAAGWDASICTGAQSNQKGKFGDQNRHGKHPDTLWMEQGEGT